MFTKEEEEKYQKDFLEFSERTFHNNHSFHITGLASLYDFQTTHDLILSLLHDKLSVHYVSIPEHAKTVMTNCTIDVGRQLPLKSLAQGLAYKYPCDRFWSTSYCPEKYPALKIKYGDSSAFLFRTGKVIFSSKSLEHIMKLYDLLELSSGPIRNHKIDSVHCCGYGLKAITNVVVI